MNLDLNMLVALASLGGTFVFVIGGWYTVKNKTENLERTDLAQQRAIENVVMWSHQHEKEAADQRQILTKELSRIEGILMVSGEHHNQVMNILEEIKERIEDLEGKK